MTSFSTASSPPIKSIQRGTVSVAKAASSTVTINSVDTAKTFVNATCRNGYSTGILGTGLYGAAILTDCVLTNSTTLTVTSGDLNTPISYVNGAPTLSWEVIEYA